MGVIPTLLARIPADAWADPRPDGLGALAAEVASARRRLAKGVNEDVELLRYHSACALIEDRVWGAIPGGSGTTGASISTPALAVCCLNDGLPSLVAIESSGASETTSALVHTVVPPDAVAGYLDALEQFIEERVEPEDHPRFELRRSRIEGLAAEGCGFVELLAGWLMAPDAAQPPRLLPASAEAPGLAGDKAGDDEDPDEDATQRAVKLEHKLREQVRDALEQRSALQLGKMPHHVVTEVLNYFTHRRPTPSSLRVVHEDGSTAEDIVFSALQRSSDGERRVYNVALMSMRHLALDADVEWAWYRNVEVSRARTLAESDAFCTAHSKALLAQLSAEGPCLIRLYHTGFMPAILGFYRSLMACWAEGMDVAVAPQYYLGPEKGFSAGTPWPRTQVSERG